jgi:hypothetical protein
MSGNTLRIEIRPKMPGFVANETYEVRFGLDFPQEIATAMLSGLLADGYEAQLFATSTTTVEVTP